MANSWSWDICVDDGIEASVLIERAVALANDTGFCAGNIYSLFDNAGDEHLFPDATSRLAWLKTHGGGIAHFDADGNDLHIGFRVTEQPDISLGTLRRMTPDDQAFIMATTRLFVRLIDEFSPAYAYSSDEWAYEAYIARYPYTDFIGEMLSCIQRGTPVPYLFWLNYFPEAYLQCIDTSIFASIVVKTERLQHGSLLYISREALKPYVATLDSNGRYHLLA